MEYHGKFGHNIGRIQHISIMIRSDICYTACCLGTQTVAPTLPCFQGLKRCFQYTASRPHNLIFYPYNSYDGSNVIKVTCSGDQVEYYKNQNFL